MTPAEILRIALPVAVVTVLLVTLVIIVRRRNAARELALSELASLKELKYTPGRKDFFQGSLPGKVTGVYRGRSLTLHYRDDPTMTRQGYNRANTSAVVEMVIQNRKQGSLTLKTRPTRLLVNKPPVSGDLFDQRIAFSSRPNTFARAMVVNPGLRQRLAELLTKDWMNPGKINVVRTGSLVFVRGGIYRSSADLVVLLDTLSDLADIIDI